MILDHIMLLTTKCSTKLSSSALINLKNDSLAKTNLKESFTQFKVVINIEIQILKLVDYFQKDASWKAKTEN